VPADKPKFDFYKILPGQEEPVSERELRERMKSGRGQQEGPKDVYFIQAGSFQNPADADNQKARLAILGFESSVEPANLPDKGTWYRVRLGPYNKLEEINRIRQALDDQRHDLVLGVVAVLAAQVEDLPAHLFERRLQTQDDAPHGVANVDERAGVPTLIDRQFAAGKGVEHELVHDQVQTRAR